MGMKQVAAVMIWWGLCWLGVSCGHGKVETAKTRPVVKETTQMPLQFPRARVHTISQPEKELFTQNIEVPASEIYTDVFKQQEQQPPRIDILIVIDNSGSMEEEQLNLSNKLTYLLSDLNGVDWQINIITTDSACKRGGDLPLTPETENMFGVFVRAVRAGTEGSGYEMAMYQTIRHLEGRCSQDDPWRRHDAKFALLIVSDEDEDDSSRYAGDAERFLMAAEGLGLRPIEDFKVYGIIGHPDRPCSTIEQVAVTYADLIWRTDGLWGSICDPDYSQALAAISEDIRLNLKVDLPLRFKPVITTIELTLDDVAYSGDWTIVGQRLILAEPLPENTTLTVRYQVESFRLIELMTDRGDLILQSLSKNGQLIDPSDYTYDVNAKTIFLKTEPGPGDLISATLVDAAPPQTVFPFPPAPQSLVSCYLGNVPVVALYDAKKEVIVIEAPPLPPGAVAHCLY